MKLNNKVNIPFTKKLYAKCSVIKNNEPYPCKIYKLSRNKDLDYFKDHQEPYWYYSCYWDRMEDFFQYKNCDTYVMETPEKECLGVVQIINKRNNKKDLVYIETCPEYSGKKDKEIKYIGETMLAFITGLAKIDNSRSIIVPYWSIRAKNFYEDHGFNLTKIKKCYNLPNKNFDALLQQNENNTSTKINYLV